MFLERNDDKYTLMLTREEIETLHNKGEGLSIDVSRFITDEVYGFTDDIRVAINKILEIRKKRNASIIEHRIDDGRVETRGEKRTPEFLEKHKEKWLRERNNLFPNRKATAELQRKLIAARESMKNLETTLESWDEVLDGQSLLEFVFQEEK